MADTHHVPACKLWHAGELPPSWPVVPQTIRRVLQALWRDDARMGDLCLAPPAAKSPGVGRHGSRHISWIPRNFERLPTRISWQRSSAAGVRRVRAPRGTHHRAVRHDGRHCPYTACAQRTSDQSEHRGRKAQPFMFWHVTCRVLVVMSPSVCPCGCPMPYPASGCGAGTTAPTVIV